MADDDDEGSFLGLYENGHWVWDDTVESLEFVSDVLPPVVEATYVTPVKVVTGAIEFRDDIDLNEQVRFRRRYQRQIKIGQPEVITLQDVKDIALYTAPLALLSVSLINLLHVPTTERFLRALIITCQYYLQVSEIMTLRMIELETKVRTPVCDILENEFRDNLSDLRALVAKEYFSMVLGVAELRKYHHMGYFKKRRSLSNKDASLMETLIRMSVQIVWLALGRKGFTQIELEVNRLIKSDIFNNIEHSLNTNYIANMGKEERNVLLGTCVSPAKKLTTRSPLLNEIFCDRPIDYRMLGIGTMKCDVMTSRLRYMEQAVSLSEESMVAAGVTVGILGIPRSVFDTMLRPLPSPNTAKGSACSLPFSAMSYSSSFKEKKSIGAADKLYPDIVLPRKSSKEDSFPDDFPDEPQPIRTSSSTDTQRRRWQERLKRMLNPQASRRRSSKFF